MELKNEDLAVEGSVENQNSDLLGQLGLAQEALNKIAQDAQEASIEGVQDVEDPRMVRVTECVRKIVLMNAIAGNRPSVQYNPNEVLKVISVQEKVYSEERNETYEALRHECYLEILDGLSDMFVVQQGIELAAGQISVEDIEAGLVGDEWGGHVGSVIHSEHAGAFTNLLREYAMQTYNIARIAADKLFIGKLGIDTDKYLEAVVKSLEAVCENNLSKFTQDKSVADSWVGKFTKAQIKEGFHIRESVVDGATWYSIVDGNGKFRKHKNFKGVDLKPILKELLDGVPEEKLVDQEVATAAFLKATKGV